MAIKLNQECLAQLPEDVAPPGYDRDTITPGILHIGVGNFFRAHQAVFLDRLFNIGLDHDWGIVGAGVMPQDAHIRDQLAAQDWLSTIVELDPRGYSARICGSLIDFVEVAPRSLIDALTRPEIRIVSLTVTEAGYFVDATTGGFDANHPDIVGDIADPQHPRTVFGMLIAALRERRESGLAPFAIMSCDNLPGNGHVTRQAVVGLARSNSVELADWIAREVAFPNGMVDCITPATGARERELVRTHFGIEDACPVVCEPFRQWVLEDRFPQGRPALEQVGVEFVEDVAPYELMKLRILNGGHAAIGYPAALMGIHYVHDAMNDPLIRAFLEKLEKEEIIPTVPPVPGVDFLEYLAVIEQRFANSKMGDTIPRLCLDGSNRQPKFILPTIADRLDKGLSVDGLALEVALWCRYCAGTRDEGQPITLVDVNADRLRQHATRALSEPGAFLEMTDIFGPVSADPVFAAAFRSALTSLSNNGTTATLEAYVNGHRIGKV